MSLTALSTPLQVVCGTIFAAASFFLLRRYLFGSPLGNIPGPKSTSFFTGNLHQLLDKDEGHAFHESISEGPNYGKVVKLHGQFGSSQLFVYDPLALHHVIVKDQHKFGLPSFFVQTIQIITSGDGLLTTSGMHHKKQRKLLNPAFSTLAMRNACPIFYQTAQKLRSAIKARVSNGFEEININSWMSRTALQIIGESGLGHSFDNLVDDATDDSYAMCVKSISPMLFSFALSRRQLPWMKKIGTPAFRQLVVDLIPSQTLHRLRDALNEQYEHSLNILTMKQQAMTDGDAATAKLVGQGKDVMSIFLRENMDAAEDDKLPDEEIIAQMNTLIIAGTDTTTSALSRLLYILASNPVAQEKLRTEIIEARAKAGGDDIPYDDLVELPYMDAVCRETLRLYPPIPHRERQATEDVVLPLSQPIKGVDGSLISEVYVPKGTHVFIGIMASNRDSDIWGNDAKEWKPERWLNPLPSAVKEANVPGIYANQLTFYGGGRSCIGFKFSQLEMKVVLATLIESFHFELPKDKEIFWNFTAIIYPSVRQPAGSTGHRVPEMPLRITLV